MKSKYLYAIGSWLLFTVAICSFQTKKGPEMVIQDRICNELDTLMAIQEEWLEKSPNDFDDQKQFYLQFRAHYKAIETYIVFRYPELDKAINGGPVPSFETDVHVLHVDDPHGLQILEELMETDFEKNEQIILDEKMRLKPVLKKLKAAFQSIPLQTWELFEAQHMAITRLINLGLSGFDSPAWLLSIQDARVVLTQMNSDALVLAKTFPSSFADSIVEELDHCLMALGKSEFDNLPRYDLYRNWLIPIQMKWWYWHSESGIERYWDIQAVPRGLGRGNHLFAADYLDPLASMKGNTEEPNVHQVELGRLLFFDPILSSDGSMACVSCHQPDLAYSDGKIVPNSKGGAGQLKRNSPSLLNSAYQSNFFWDMRSRDLNDQISHVVFSSDEFDNDFNKIVQTLSESVQYTALFEKAFPTYRPAISPGTIKLSLEFFIRSLNSWNSKLDLAMRGELNLNPDEQKGFDLFFGKAACVTCHFAPNFNGYVPPHYLETEGEIIGVLKQPTKHIVDDDWGMYHRFQYAYPEAGEIKGLFKTPSLRNVELTAPYMHNGSFKNLAEVIAFYNHGGALGLGLPWPQQTLSADSLNLTNREREQLLSFLLTLTDRQYPNQIPNQLPTFGDDRDHRSWNALY